MQSSSVKQRNNAKSLAYAASLDKPCNGSLPRKESDLVTMLRNRPWFAHNRPRIRVQEIPRVTIATGTKQTRVRSNVAAEIRGPEPERVKFVKLPNFGSFTVMPEAFYEHPTKPVAPPLARHSRAPQLS